MNWEIGMLFCWRLRCEIWNIYWLLQELKFITDNWKLIEILAPHVGPSAVDDSSDNCVYCTFCAAWVDLLLLKSKWARVMDIVFIIARYCFQGLPTGSLRFWAFSNLASTTECLNTKWRNDEKALQEKDQCAYIGVPKSKVVQFCLTHSELCIILGGCEHWLDSDNIILSYCPKTSGSTVCLEVAF